MLTRALPVSILVLCTLFPTTLLGQEKTAPSAAPPGPQEFPVVMQQNVVAGKTPVGSKVQAKLEVATLIGGTVVPRNAVFSGEVIESAAKTATDPSRVAIRIDSVLWKKGSASVTAYLTAWYYPTRDSTGQDLQYGPTQPAKKTWDGLGQYPDTTTKVYRPFPGQDTNKGGSVPDTPAAVASNRRVLMKDIESAKNDDGMIAIVSKKTNIKLDKLTTYVLATGDLLPPK
jgi:hypothetical protein